MKTLYELKRIYDQLNRDWWDSHDDREVELLSDKLKLCKEEIDRLQLAEKNIISKEANDWFVKEILNG